MTIRNWDEIQQQIAKRYVVAPQPLIFTGIPLDYWREEVALNCAVALARLRAICAERGADYEGTIRCLRNG